MANFTLSVKGFDAYSGVLQPIVIPPAPTEYPFITTILPDYLRTFDKRPRTHGRYPDTTPSVEYRNMKDYYSNVGCPDQVNLFDDTWFELNSDKQWLWMNVNCLATYGKTFTSLVLEIRKTAKAQWASLTDGGRCFTNGKGWNNGYHDWVQPKNPLVAKGVQQEQIVCSLNKVKVIGPPKPISSNYLGLGNRSYMHYPIECLDPNKPLPTPQTLLRMDWICHKPSISTGQYLGDGKYEIIPFPQFNENSRYILWGKNGIGWIRADWIAL